jgi:hypothetical protein
MSRDRRLRTLSWARSHITKGTGREIAIGSHWPVVMKYQHATN